MTDPTELTDAIDRTADAFSHAHGTPAFEPGIDASPDVESGKVQVQKGCRLLLAAESLQRNGEYYTSVVEHAFTAIERTLEGYLIRFAGSEPSDFHDHETVYRQAQRQAPLERDTLEALEALYSTRRTEHYYGTTVATERQATELLTVAEGLHEYVVGFEPVLEGYCSCDG